MSKKEILHQLCVYGYIREHCIIYEVPQVLKELCYLFTIDPMDKWNCFISSSDFIYSYHMNLSNHICRLYNHKKDSNKWRNAFGSLIIKQNELQIWRLRIINIANSDQFGAGKLKRSVMIGIISIIDRQENVTKSTNDKNNKNDNESLIVEKQQNKMRLMNSYFCDTKYKKEFEAYAFYAYDGNLFCTKHKRRCYGSKWDRGDIITMTLDMTGKNGKLSFKINNKEQGVAFNDIDNTKQYCLAVSFFFEEEG